MALDPDDIVNTRGQLDVSALQRAADRASQVRRVGSNANGYFSDLVNATVPAIPAAATSTNGFVRVTGPVVPNAGGGGLNLYPAVVVTFQPATGWTDGAACWAFGPKSDTLWTFNDTGRPERYMANQVATNADGLGIYAVDLGLSLAGFGTAGSVIYAGTQTITLDAAANSSGTPANAVLVLYQVLTDPPGTYHVSVASAGANSNFHQPGVISGMIFNSQGVREWSPGDMQFDVSASPITSGLHLQLGGGAAQAGGQDLWLTYSVYVGSTAPSLVAVANNPTPGGQPYGFALQFLLGFPCYGVQLYGPNNTTWASPLCYCIREGANFYQGQTATVSYQKPGGGTGTLTFHGGLLVASS